MRSALMFAVIIVIGFSMTIGLIGCGSNSSQGSSPSVESILPKGIPTRVESFILQDVQGKPQLTYVEFPEETVFTARDSDGVRTESLHISKNSEGKFKVERALGEDWARLYASPEARSLSIELKAFWFYLRTKLYNDVAECRSSKHWKKAVESLREKLPPVLVSIDGNRKKKKLEFGISAEIDLDSSRLIGITVDSGSSFRLDDTIYLAIAPEWLVDGRVSTTLLGTIESYELGSRCRTAIEQDYAFLHGRPDTRSAAKRDVEWSQMVDWEIERYGSRKSLSGAIWSGRDFVSAAGLNSARYRFRYSPTESEIDRFFGESSR